MKYTSIFVLAIGLLVSDLHAQNQSFAEARKGFKTQLATEVFELEAPEDPPRRLFDLVTYQSGESELSAYVSPKLGKQKKQPIVIWLVGGFGSGIGDSYAAGIMEWASKSDFWERWMMYWR